MSVLLHRRRELAAAQITALEERRAEIAANLQKMHTAAVSITGKASTPVILDRLLKRGHHAGDAERAAVRLWLNYSGYKDLPVKDAALTTAFYYPKELAALIEASEDYFPESKEPRRYWKGDKFVAPPVTDEERAAITERSEIRAKTEDDAELYRSAEKIVNLANLRNRTAGTNVVVLRDLTTDSNIIYNGLIKVKPAGPHPLDEPSFEVDDTAFNMVEISYKAFDE
jgi:hypothetical protein